MKTLLIPLIAALFVVSGGLAADTPAVLLTPPGLPQTDRLPGVDLAEGLSQITGTAISPLLGVSSVGAWRYFHTPESLRAALPWFCHPRVWGFGFAVLALCFFKDLFGTIAPPLLKKPFDIAELFENKLSALVASAAFVPFIASQMAQHFSAADHAQIAAPSHIHYAALLPIPIATFAFDFRLFAIPLAILAFLTVWLAGHVINVLIALCPFGFIDALLKLAKLTLLSSVVLSYLVNPYIGAVVSLMILCCAAVMAPWAFRLSRFGTLMSLDTIAPARARRAARPDEPHCFLACALPNAPVRTYGRFARSSDGCSQFKFRRWLLSRCTMPIPPGTTAISQGVVFPSVLHTPDPATPMRPLLNLLPRYRGLESAIAVHFGISDILSSPLLKGFKAVRAWIGEIITSNRTRLPFRQAVFANHAVATQQTPGPVYQSPAHPQPQNLHEHRLRIAKDGRDLGEISIATVQAMIDSGQLTAQDFWLDAQANQWVPLATLFQS